ncbi:hypothetical protein Cni_G08516 [Canna indica]|uniref:Aldehyde dehydrogenase domain-containing protein n=1 Tax=Canna indica TaxID=4628 RepID=A0AAQ3Q8R8_9LILI|nr:hypothetical protein Cni_G08516 [Canna indica]
MLVNDKDDSVIIQILDLPSWADKIHGLIVPADGPLHVQVLHEPIGVAGQIIPWNFPLLMFAWKVGPSLAFGNAIILKSVEQTLLYALFVSKLFHEGGDSKMLKANTPNISHKQAFNSAA